MRSLRLGGVLIAVMSSSGVAGVITGSGTTAFVTPAGPGVLFSGLTLGGSQGEIELSAFSRAGNNIPSYGAGIYANPPLQFTSSSLPFGTLLDSSLAFNSGGIVEFAQISTMPPIVTPGGQIAGYYGFSANGANGPYGWIDVDVEANLQGYASATIYQWAYSPDGSPLSVGDVPEPVGSAILSAMLPAISLTRRRQRR